MRVNPSPMVNGNSHLWRTTYALDNWSSDRVAIALYGLLAGNDNVIPLCCLLILCFLEHYFNASDVIIVLLGEGDVWIEL